MNDKCPQCGGTMVVKVTTIHLSMVDCNQEHKVNFIECEKCGEKYFDLDMLKKFLDAGETNNNTKH